MTDHFFSSHGFGLQMNSELHLCHKVSLKERNEVGAQILKKGFGLTTRARMNERGSDLSFIRFITLL